MIKLSIPSSLCTLLLLFILTPLHAAEVKNINIVQDGKNVIVEYDLIGKLGEREAEVVATLELMGERYSYEKLTVEGNVGKAVKLGLKRRFVWHPQNDYPSGYEGEAVWDVSTRDELNILAARDDEKRKKQEEEARKRKLEEEEQKRQLEEEEKKRKLEEEKRLAKAMELAALEKARLEVERAEKERKKVLFDHFAKKMVPVKGGCYKMGCDSWAGNGLILSGCESNEKPTHEACVRDFSISKYEVTQEDWMKVTGINPSYFKNCGKNCPVDSVSWDDVQDFIMRLNNMSGGSFRLPTEAEWEYAARSQGQFEKYSGSDKIDLAAWYSGNSNDTTHPVGQKSANALGLFDMTGNVWEWVNDWYHPKYYANSTANNPQGPATGTEKVYRGGSFNFRKDLNRNTFRGSDRPTERDRDTGFRLALTDPVSADHPSPSETSQTGTSKDKPEEVFQLLPQHIQLKSIF